MIVKTCIKFAKYKGRLRNYMKTGFRDSLQLYVSGGAGGNGLPKFGGVGGQGGNVIVTAKEDINLEDVFKKNKTKQYSAENGRNSSANFIRGAPGQDIKIEVPVGVSIHTELGKHLGELNGENEELIVARGGIGGHSKNGFLGKQGESYPIILDLKLIADIGLVGFPNAGKSTLLGAISHAKPKIANYPFTTVRPHLGMLRFKDERQISMADLPGLIEGAHLNKGMGHSFLKHVERTKILLLVVDINGFQLGPQYPHRSCLDTIILLNKELELYKPHIVEKPSMILINKMDTPGAAAKYDQIKHFIKNLSSYSENCAEEIKPEKFLKFREILPVSIKENEQDIQFLKEKLRKHLDILEEEKSQTNSDLYEEMRGHLRERGPKLL